MCSIGSKLTFGESSFLRVLIPSLTDLVEFTEPVELAEPAEWSEPLESTLSKAAWHLEPCHSGTSCQ